MTQHSFIPLHVHSAFSLSEGAIKIPDLIEACHHLSMPAVALTDTGNLFGAMEFSLACQKKGIQPIIGAQMRLLVEELEDENQPIHHTELSHVVLLVQNQEGYQNLLKHVSQSYLRTDRTKLPHITWQELKNHNSGLILLTGGKGGPVNVFIEKKKIEQTQNLLKNLQAIFDDRLYIELARFHEPFEAILEETLLDLAYKLSLPLVATNQAFFLSESLYEAHDALLCIAEGKQVTDTNRRRVTPHHHLKSPQVMKELFQDLPEALANTVIIAKRCAFMVETVAPVLPSFPCQRPEKEELRAQVQEGLKKRLENQVLHQDMSPSQQQETIALYQQRLDYEYEIIERMGFSGYYLIVADFIKWAKANDIPVGPGRGSGAGSLVAWSLTITDIDPIRFGLLFERFLNPERVSMPDFDVDFCQERRDEVIEYVSQRYGKDHVAQIITFGKLQSKMVVRDVGRVLGMPYGQVDRISKLIPHNPANPISLKEAIAQESQLQAMINDDPQVAKLMTIGQQLEGLYRHASTHAAGIVISKEPLEKVVPLYHDGESALPATQFHMKHVELAGLVKFDFLGLKTLTVIQKTIFLLRGRSIHLDISKIPLDDAATFALLQRVEAVGIFQVESAGMREVMRRLHPQRFEELIALVALYRPGPMDDIPRYLACKHGEEKVYYAHPLIELILKETFGVMVYQEQVMQIAQVLAGYSLGQADLLRRAMGKKIKSEMDAQADLFIKGAMEKGVPKEVARKVFEQAAKFAGYGFNKCHSAPYALIAYQTAYLKANYPVEFMAALMISDMHNTDKIMIFREEVQRLGIDLLAPDINASYPEFHVEQTPDGSFAVRYALAAIKGVGMASMQEVIKEREGAGPYKSIADFIERLDSKVINRRTLEKLIAAGAFDPLHPNRAALMVSVEDMLKYAKEYKEKAISNQGTLFKASGGASIQAPPLREVSEWPHLQKLDQEFQAMGFYFSAHPLAAYGSYLGSLGLTPSSQLYDFFQRNEGSTVALAGVILVKKERVSKKGSRYAFVQFSDQSGIFEVTFFSELLAQYQLELEPGRMFYLKVSGKVEEDSLRLTVHEAQLLEEKLQSNRRQLVLTVREGKALPSVRDILQPLPKGRTQVRLRLLSKPCPVLLRLPYELSISQETCDNLTQIPGVIFEEEKQAN